MPTTPLLSSPLTAYVLRLHPGDDLRQQLAATVQTLGVQAGAVLTCVGSLTTVVLRLANHDHATTYHGYFEIVSLVGTLSVHGSHLHIAVADTTGRTVGGHLLDGSVVYTTAELVLGVLPALAFRREQDAISTYHELAVYSVDVAPEKP